MSYDQKCYDLAEVFLSDIQNPVNYGDADALAQEIQRTIEDYLQEVEGRTQAAIVESTFIDEPPPALKAEIDNSLKAAISQAKVWDKFFDNLLNPRKEPS